METNSKKRLLQQLTSDGYASVSKFEELLKDARNSDNMLVKLKNEKSNLTKSVIEIRREYLELVIHIIENEPSFFMDNYELIGEYGLDLSKYVYELQKLKQIS